jgi:hypothetical protein
MLDDSSDDTMHRLVFPSEADCFAWLRTHYENDDGLPDTDDDLIDWITAFAVVYIDEHEVPLAELASRVAHYRQRQADRDASLAEFYDSFGEVIESEYARYDEQRTDNAYEADEDLDMLLDELERLTR